MKMNSDLLSALDAEESGNGRGFVTTISYENRDVKSSDMEEDDDDEIIIVDKEKQNYMLRKTGPVRAQPPLSRQHKDAMDFSSKELGRIPKISSPKTLPKAKRGGANTYQPYQSKMTSNTRQVARKRSHDNTEHNTQESSGTTTPQEITLYASPSNNQPLIVTLNSPGANLRPNLVPGILQITSSGQKGSKLYQLIPQIQTTEASSAATEIMEVSKRHGRHSITSLPTQMTPSPVKLQMPITSPTSSSATEDSVIENDDDESESNHVALCANCGIKSRSLVKCDSCKCDFSVKKYLKLITVSKEETAAAKKNLQLRSGPFVIHNFYSNKSTGSSFLLPVKRQPPPSRSASINWKEPYRLKTYSPRRPKKTAEPVCISISSDEEEEPMSQDEETSNGLDDRNSPVFDRLSQHMTRSNGRVQSNSVFTDDSDSELQSNSHHRTDDADSGSGYNTTSPKKLTRKQKMRNKNEQLLEEKKEKAISNVRLKDDDLSDCSLDNMDITVQDGLRCISVVATLVRIGSQEYKSCTSVEFQWNQIVLQLTGTSSQQLELKTSELISCMFFISSSKFSIFLQTVPAVGIHIRERFKMNNSICYDPGSSDESKKTINIHADKLTENEIIRLRKLLESYQVINKDLKCIELDRDSIDISLEKCRPTTPKDDKSHSAFDWIETTPTSTSTDQLPQSTTRATPTQATLQLIYPPNASKGRISVTSEDVSCLAEGEFINDVIIDFYLKYLLHEILSEEVRERTHIFSSFFYKRLSRRVPNMSKFELGPHRSVAERRHSHVKSWTRNVDLFQKDFIVIPVNESAHWYVAIVCFPGKFSAIPTDLQKNTLDKGVSDNQIIPESTQPNSNNTESDEIDNPTNASPSKPILQEEGEDAGESDTIPDGERTNEDETESTEENSPDNLHLTNNSDSDQPTSTSVGITEQNGVNCHDNIQEAIRNNKKLDAANNVFHAHQSYEFQQPCILIFDSLKGTSKRNTCINKLKEYISVEWKIKKGKQREFEFKGMQPEVPQQSNYHDCGVYVLQYVESFFTMPIKNFGTPLKGLSEWFNEDRVNCKREDVKMLISNLKELHKNKR